MKKSLLILSLLGVIALAGCNNIDVIRTKELMQTQEGRVELCNDRILKLIDSGATQFIGSEVIGTEGNRYHYIINFIGSDGEDKEYSCITTNSRGYSIDLQEVDINEGGEQPICTEEYEPVCGADGKLYSNRCFMEIAGVEEADGGLVMKKECNEDYYNLGECSQLGAKFDKCIIFPATI